MQGLYIHVPFCVKKCLYCDFYSVTRLDLIADYVRALCREISLFSTGREKDFLCVDTVYFGGGTPSLLRPEHLEEILDTVAKNYSLARDTEITVEVNPGTHTEEQIMAYRALGINRLSIGVQSFNDQYLDMLGRIHTADQARSLILSARKAGFDNLGLDLISGLPGQTKETWQKELDEALSFSPEHLSCYMLTWEAETPLDIMRERGAISPLDEATCAALFLQTRDTLTDRGYHHYEISNYAKTQSLCSRHNLKYWEFQPYAGFGPSSHSYDPVHGTRRWNMSDLSAYLESLDHDVLPVEETERLDTDQQMTEALFLGLRNMSGINIPSFNYRFACDFSEMFHDVLVRLTEAGYIEHQNDCVRLTRNGLLLADSITSLFVRQVT